MDALSTLQHYYGFSSFRPLQQEAVDSILSGQDTFVLMPTGGGKSLCYALPSLLMEGTTVVVSPLIALMKDQVDGLLANGISAAFLNSSMAHEEQAEVTDRVLAGSVKLL